MEELKMENEAISYTACVQFLTIVKYMNMNRAAEELFISQPALSSSIQRLEKELGIKLFDRNKNKLTLNKNGEELLYYFKQFKSAHDEIFDKARSLASVNSKSIIKIAFTGSSYTFSSIVTSGLLETLEDTVLSFCYVDQEEAKNMIRNGNVDLIISSVPIISNELSSHEIFREPIGLVINKNNPLAKRKKISIDDINGLKCHGLAQNNQFRILCDYLLKNRGVKADYVTEDVPNYYYQRILSSSDNCIFFATEKTYNSTFKPVIKYVYLPVIEIEFTQVTNIYYSKTKNLKIDLNELSEIVQKNYFYQR